MSYICSLCLKRADSNFTADRGGCEFVLNYSIFSKPIKRVFDVLLSTRLVTLRRAWVLKTFCQALSQVVPLVESRPSCNCLQVGFVKDPDDYAFGFLDPALVTRGRHLILAFAEGRTRPTSPWPTAPFHCIWCIKSGSSANDTASRTRCPPFLKVFDTLKRAAATALDDVLKNNNTIFVVLLSEAQIPKQHLVVSSSLRNFD